MADIASLILRVRRRVHDALSEDVPHYSDDVYNDALNRALDRVNLALGENHTVAQLPTRAEYLVELRTTIEMCFIRGAEGTTGDVTDNPDLPPQSLTLPGGFTQSSQQMSYEGPRFWLRLAERLEQEYRDILDDVIDSISAGSAITMGVIQRMSNRSRRAMSYFYDRPLGAPDIAVSVSSNNVLLGWQPVLSEFLETYRIERSQDDFITITEVFVTHDNQVNMYIDAGVLAGVYKYRLKVVNTNDLASYSPIAQVTIL